MKRLRILIGMCGLVSLVSCSTALVTNPPLERKVFAEQHSLSEVPHPVEKNVPAPPKSAREAAASILSQLEPHLHFDPGQAAISLHAVPSLKELAQVMAQDPALRLNIAGHTDSTGSTHENQKLAVQRAAEVKRVLVENGVNGDRVSSEGVGSKLPKATNQTAEGRRENRRAEIEFTP
jgi:outer membrane protein OmpA-like peptidoglycan-associated protein